MRVYTDLNDLPPFRQAVMTIGSFDGVHRGHQQILEQVRSLARSCDGESIVLTFDPHPRTVLQPDKPPLPLLTSLAEKAERLQACGIDHLVVMPFTLEFSRLTPQQYVHDFLARYFKPRYIVIGYDHRFGADRAGDLSFLKKSGITAGFDVVEIAAQKIDEIAVSSTKIRQAIEAGELNRANHLLGYPYRLTGEVVLGDQIGRTIGFPTANLQLAEPHKLTPPSGIYAARAAAADGQRYDAMLYLGNRPTINGVSETRIEVNLLDFDGDLYGQTLRVEVVDFIRPDRKLPDLPALQQQISADKVAIEQRLKSAVSPQDDVAIVILNYNTRKHLETYLPSVIAHSAGARVVVADNGSPDDSVAFLRQHYPDVEVLDLQQNYGFAQGYNEALRQVKADIYVILNSDVEVSAGWMEPILDAMRLNPTIAVAQPKILAWRDRNRFEYAGASGGWVDYLGYPFCRGRIFGESETDQGQYDTPQQCFWASGAAFFIRAELYHAFGGFDGDYFAHNEEIDLCWRLKRAGYAVWCFPQSVVWHLGGGTLEYESPRKVFLNFRNSLFTLLRNEPWGKLCWLIPARLVLDGVAAALFASKGQYRSIRAILQAHGAFYANFGKMLTKRRTANAQIAQQRIGKSNRAGIYGGSLVFAHYLRRVRRFAALHQKS